jgi:hypothetical protein
MSRLSAFFKETHTALGVFYPLHCLIAVFPNLDAAQQVGRNLRNAGFAEDEVIAVEGSEFIELEKEETNLGNFLMQALSRFLAAEQISTDHNIEFADRAAAFVVVHCPTEKAKKEAWDVIQASAPLAAHYYSKGSVDHLAGGFSTD